jgi:hypothetical protein
MKPVQRSFSVGLCRCPKGAELAWYIVAVIHAVLNAVAQLVDYDVKEKLGE